MGIFSRSPRNAKRNKVLLTAFPSEDSILDAPPVLSKNQLMHNALLKMSGRRKFRAAVHAVKFSNMIGYHIESRRRNMRKLRASVRCINFVKLLEERLVARRKFRASVDTVELVNSLAKGIAARRKFRAAITVAMLSDRLVNKPLHEPFDLRTFQDAVNLVRAVNELERPFPIPTFKEEHSDMVRRTGMEHLGEAVDKVLEGEGREEMVKPKWFPMTLKGSLVHQSKDFTTLWRFVEREKVAPNKE